MKDWDIRKLGGFKAAKDFLYPNTDVDLALKSSAKKVKAYRGKLDQLYGDRLLEQEEFIDTITELVSKSDFKVHPSKKAKDKASKKSRTLVAHVSDTHLGANIEADEMGNVNEFNWTVASRRFALFAEQVISYKPHYRKDTNLVILLNGDIMAGMIHNQEFFVDMLALQQVGTIHLLTQFISYIAQHFDNVTIEVTEGNHERAMHKSSKERGSTTKWDNYLTPVYYALKEILKTKCPNITFNIPKTPYTIFKAQGHLLFATHGDTVINAGNPGKALNMSSISNQINKLNASELGGKESFAAVICGHCHVNTLQLTDAGAFFMVNGCLSGSDPYAQSIGIFSNAASQQIFEVTEDYAVGDFRMVQLLPADKNESLDRIIEPFKGKL